MYVIQLVTVTSQGRTSEKEKKARVVDDVMFFVSVSKKRKKLHLPLYNIVECLVSIFLRMFNGWQVYRDSVVYCHYALRGLFFSSMVCGSNKPDFFTLSFLCLLCFTPDV